MLSRKRARSPSPVTTQKRRRKSSRSPSRSPNGKSPMKIKSLSQSKSLSNSKSPMQIASRSQSRSSSKGKSPMSQSPKRMDSPIRLSPRGTTRLTPGDPKKRSQSKKVTTDSSMYYVRVPQPPRPKKQLTDDFVTHYSRIAANGSRFLAQHRRPNEKSIKLYHELELFPAIEHIKHVHKLMNRNPAKDRLQSQELRPIYPHERVPYIRSAEALFRHAAGINRSKTKFATAHKL